MFFISLILILIVVVVIVIGAYYLVIHLIKLWTGCEMMKQMQNYIISSTAQLTAQ